MIKVTLILASFLALTTAAVIFADDATNPCLYENELWGSEDGTKFYFCLPDTETVIEQDCPQDTFFVKNATTSGCVPLAKMDPHCVNLGAVGPCTGKNLLEPQPSSVPTQFYLCPSEGAQPVQLKCEEGKAFVNQDGYLGCFTWPKWRTIRDCTE